MIRSIFAVDAQGGIGKDSTLPWPKDPEDLRWFKTSTTGDIVVMGKNTWMDPMMPKPLPNRFNIVVTSRDFHSCNAAHMVVSGINLDSTLRNLATIHDRRTIWIIGGAQLLRSTAHLIEQIYLTRFDESYDCDVTIDIDMHLDGYHLLKEHLGVGKRFQIYEKLP